MYLENVCLLLCKFEQLSSQYFSLLFLLFVTLHICDSFTHPIQLDSNSILSPIGIVPNFDLGSHTVETIVLPNCRSGIPWILILHIFYEIETTRCGSGCTFNSSTSISSFYCMIETIVPSYILLSLLWIFNIYISDKILHNTYVLILKVTFTLLVPNLYFFRLEKIQEFNIGCLKLKISKNGYTLIISIFFKYSCWYKWLRSWICISPES